MILDSKTIWLLVKRTRNEFEMVCLETLLKGLYNVYSPLSSIPIWTFLKTLQRTCRPAVPFKELAFLRDKSQDKKLFNSPLGEEKIYRSGLYYNRATGSYLALDTRPRKLRSRQGFCLSREWGISRARGCIMQEDVSGKRMYHARGCIMQEDVLCKRINHSRGWIFKRICHARERFMQEKV